MTMLMKTRRLLCLIIIIIMCVIFMPVWVTMAETTQTTYYVSISGSDSNVGTSQDEPFQTLNYAVEMANGGDVIVIVDSAVANDTGLDAPLVIDKKLIIRGDAAMLTLPSISVRAGGIILGADVTFEHLQIGVASFLRPGIAANGHTLTLRNVHQDETLRPLQIYGGTFYDYSDNYDGTNYGEDYVGEESNINIIGGSFDGIYAGSVNGGFDKPVNISICEIDSDNTDVKYDFGIDKGIFAASTIKNPGDLVTSGQIPVLDCVVSIDSVVSVSVNDNSPVKKVFGCAESHTLYLTTNGVGYYSFEVDCIDSLTVQGGTFVVTGSFGESDSNMPDIILTGSEENKATLDVSAFTNISVDDFTGSENGILVLNSDSFMIINGTLSGGATEFRTGGGMPWSSAENPGYSGWIEYETMYISAAEGNGTFVISNPYGIQTVIKFTDDSSATNGWTTIEEMAYEIPELLDFTPISTIISYSDVNFENSDIAINVIQNYSTDEELPYLYFVPIDYKVTYTDVDGTITEYIQQSSILDDYGYYYCDYMDISDLAGNESILMTFWPDADILYIYPGDGELRAGTYVVTMTAATGSKTITKTFTLTVLEEGVAEPAVTFTCVDADNTSVSYGENLVFTAEVSDVENTPVGVGNVQFFINGLLYGDAVSIQSGIAELTVLATAENGFVKDYNEVTAVYLGTDDYMYSMGMTEVQVEPVDCEHITNNNEVVYTDNEDGTHSFTCNVCNSKVIEEHIPVYMATGAVISADCVCGKNYGSIVIAASDTEYNGMPVTATVENTIDSNDYTSLIVYTAEEGSALTDGKPVNPGSYIASITIEDKKASVKFAIVDGHIDENLDDKCDYCGAIVNSVGAKLTGYSLCLNGNIGVNFHMELNEDVAKSNTAYMHFILPNGITKDVPVRDIKPTTMNGRVCYIFSCDVSAKEMTEEIKAQFFVDGQEGTLYTCTVKDYADYILEHESEYSEVVALVKAMLNYGAYSQMYFGYNTDKMANADLTESDRKLSEVTLASLQDYTAVVDKNESICSFETVYLALKSETAVNVKVKLAEGVTPQEDDVQFIVNGNILDSAEYSKDGDCYVLTVDRIKASALDSMYEFKVIVGADEATLKYGALSYCKTVLSGEYDDSLKDVVTALRIFNIAADEYIKIK